MMLRYFAQISGTSQYSRQRQQKITKSCKMISVHANMFQILQAVVAAWGASTIQVWLGIFISESSAYDFSKIATTIWHFCFIRHMS